MGTTDELVPRGGIGVIVLKGKRSSYLLLATKEACADQRETQLASGD